MLLEVELKLQLVFLTANAVTDERTSFVVFSLDCKDHQPATFSKGLLCKRVIIASLLTSLLSSFWSQNIIFQFLSKMMVHIDSHMNSTNVIRLYSLVSCGPLPKSSVNWVRIWELSGEREC